MDRPITRRDFLNGIAIGTAAAGIRAALGRTALGHRRAQLATRSPPKMPPATTHRCSPACAAVTRVPSKPPTHCATAGPSRRPLDTGEEYDLIVVGGGISGLAAAHFYRAHTSPDSRILILDNHDDFGGHAKRNEFNLDGRLNLLNGGTLEIDSPRPYGPVAAGLLQTLGIDVAKLIKTTQHLQFYEQPGTAGGRLLRSRDLRRRQARGRHRHGRQLAASARAARRSSARARAQIVADRDGAHRLPARACHPTRRSSACRASATKRSCAMWCASIRPCSSSTTRAPWANGAWAPMPCPRSTAGASTCRVSGNESRQGLHRAHGLHARGL